MVTTGLILPRRNAPVPTVQDGSPRHLGRELRSGPRAGPDRMGITPPMLRCKRRSRLRRRKPHRPPHAPHAALLSRVGNGSRPGLPGERRFGQRGRQVLRGKPPHSARRQERDVRGPFRHKCTDTCSKRNRALADAAGTRAFSFSQNSFKLLPV